MTTAHEAADLWWQENVVANIRRGIAMKIAAGHSPAIALEDFAHRLPSDIWQWLGDPRRASGPPISIASPRLVAPELANV